MRVNTILPALLVVALYALVPLAVGHVDYVMSLIVAALTIGGIAVAWALLGNLGGMVSFGHAAFFGVGAYVSALLTLDAGWPVFPAMLAGGLGAVVASIATMPALRLRGRTSPSPSSPSPTSSASSPPSSRASPMAPAASSAFRCCRPSPASTSAPRSAATT